MAFLKLRTKKILFQLHNYKKQFCAEREKKSTLAFKRFDYAHQGELSCVGLFLSAFFVFWPDCLFDDKFCLLNFGIFQALSEALQAYRKAWLKLCVLYALFYWCDCCLFRQAFSVRRLSVD